MKNIFINLFVVAALTIVAGGILSPQPLYAAEGEVTCTGYGDEGEADRWRCRGFATPPSNCSHYIGDVYFCPNEPFSGYDCTQQRSWSTLLLGHELKCTVIPKTPSTTNTPNIRQSTNPTCPGRPVGELCYTPLEPLPGDIDESGKPGSFGSLLNGVFRILISLGGLVAVLSLVIGGIAYMTSDAVNKTEWARGRIRNALWGLFILITSVLLLQTINPQLLNFNFIPGNQTSSTPLEVTATQSNYQFFTAGSQFGQEITATGANLLDAPPYGSVLKVNTSKVPISNFQDHITLFTQACEGAGGKVLPAQGQSSAAFLCTKR